MIDMLRVILRPALNRHGARLHGKFVVTLDGRQLCISRQPLLDAARILLKEGVTRNADRHPACRRRLRCHDVDRRRGGKVDGTRRRKPRGLRFVRWKAFSRDAVSHPCVLTSGRHQNPCSMPNASTTPIGCRHEQHD